MSDAPERIYVNPLAHETNWVCSDMNGAGGWDEYIRADLGISEGLRERIKSNTQFALDTLRGEEGPIPTAVFNALRSTLDILAELEAKNV